ncbi:MAG: molybdenum cofactor guanylyltransferase [Proteobacteria bacterium]|nr:molybdenum cofactor guanylyltransferase [Pseudomonadota bacterium]
MSGRFGAVVLAGGQSRRLGRDKALLDIDGVACARRVLEAVRPLVGEICVVGGSNRFADWGVAWLPDAVTDAGPLGGLITGLRALDADASFALACDLPLLSTPVLARLQQAFEAAPEAPAVVVRHAGRLEPLVAIYNRAALPALEAALSRGERALHRVLARLPVREVDAESLRDVDIHLDGFLNLNTEDDAARIRARLDGGRE